MNGPIFNPREVVSVPVDGDTQKAISSDWAHDHAADADAHHPEEIPEGRGLYGGVYLATIPGIHPWLPGIFAMTAARIYYMPIYVRTPITIDQVIIEVTTAAGAGNKCRVAIYAADVNWQPLALQVASAEIAIDAIAVVTTAIAATILQEGRYLMAITLQANATLRAMRYTENFLGLGVTFGANANLLDIYVAAAYAALPDPGTAWDTITAGNEPLRYPVLLRVLTP